MKPQPEIYRRALQDVKGDADASFFMGDGASRELEGAASAGLRPLRIDHPEKFSLLRGEVGPTPEFPVFKSFDEVIAHLDR
jgi:FMN phosphatase YigB (HAD superfamily)